MEPRYKKSGVKNTMNFDSFTAYADQSSTYTVIANSMFISEYGSGSRYAHVGFQNTGTEHSKVFMAESLQSSVAGFGLVDWNGTWKKPILASYDFLQTAYKNKRIELFAPDCGSGRVTPVIIKNGKLCDGDDILYEFEDGKWYHFSILFDPLKHLIYIDINGERAVDGKYSEKLSGTMRPLYMITGISDPYSVMMIDNYRIEELDTIPDISVSASAANGYIQAGTSQITVRTAAAITKNDITVVKNGEVQSFDIMAGENGVYNITLSDAAHIGDRYTLKLENAAFCSVKRFRFISDGLAAVTACGTRKEGDTLYLSIKTLNKTGSPQRMNIVTAFYKNGKMQDAAINTVFALNGEMTSEFSLKTGVSADNFKIFLASPESLERLD